MAKASTYDDFTISETGNWNVADRFTKVKIMLPMAKCEMYEDLAQFGYDDFIDEIINYYNVPMDVTRLKGLTHLIKELLKICKNVKFAMKKAGTKQELQKYEDQLKSIQKVIPSVYKIHFDQIRKTKNIVLIESKFDVILERVIEIKSKINEPLNKNDLIFVSKEEFDPKEFKKKMMERMANKG